MAQAPERGLELSGGDMKRIYDDDGRSVVWSEAAADVRHAERLVAEAFKYLIDKGYHVADAALIIVEQATLHRAEQALNNAFLKKE
jgi:hypothetical protein